MRAVPTDPAVSVGNAWIEATDVVVLLFDALPPPEHAATTAMRTARFNDREPLTTRDATRATNRDRTWGELANCDREIPDLAQWAPLEELVAPPILSARHDNMEEEAATVDARRVVRRCCKA